MGVIPNEAESLTEKSEKEKNNESLAKAVSFQGNFGQSQIFSLCEATSRALH